MSLELAKIRHVPRQQKQFEEEVAPFYWLVIKHGVDIKAFSKELQEKARKERARRKQMEAKEDAVRVEAELKRNMVLFEKLRSNIRITSRLHAPIYIEKDGTFSWHCPGSWTDDHEKRHKCKEVQRVSLVQEKPIRGGFLAATTSYIAEAGKGKTKEPIIRDVEGRGARTEVIGGKVEVGGVPIIQSLADSAEIVLVMRCPRCFTADDLRITLGRV